MNSNEVNCKFNLGKIVVTQGVADLIPPDIQLSSLLKHCVCKWGAVSNEDKIANDNAVKNGERILSAYFYKDIKFWIITEADRSTTTILLPDEY